jgi:ERCC4-type nuclease
VTLCSGSPRRTRKQGRPIVATPTARAAGIEPLEIIVDTREQCAYRFSTHQVVLQRRALLRGDYGVTVSEGLVAVVERKSRTDLVSSLLNGKLRYLLAALPRSHVRPSWSRTATRRSSDSVGYDRHWSPTARALSPDIDRCARPRI